MRGLKRQRTGALQDASRQPPPALAAAPDQWPLHSLLSDGNLANRNVSQVAFETNGTAWLATSDGLFRYDGYRWESFAQSNGLPASFIGCVRVTRKGALWVGTDRGAGVFDGQRYDTQGSERGLATAYGIIRQHDGGIQARSELGKGSAFDIYLPAAESRGADAP